MTAAPPPYFERVRSNAAQRWDKLEADAELAAPWHQLFHQVQSPRHVISELLQNADDADASEATVILDGDTLVFSHNGRDFAEDEFASLCRFGYSNKRILHTIGFRGIGFKSTFSLGSRVELITPTLSVCFERHRFTEPLWVSRPLSRDGTTVVRVAISNRQCRAELERNLDEWARSPVSLLFMRHIRRLRINDHDLQWSELSRGPVENSSWVKLAGHEGRPLLVIISDPEAFPEDAVNEIRQERLLTSDEEPTLPPCQIEIVLGADQRLFVVLPTGVETGLPFACNAPFIQDPARLKIKDPATSPTNRWLLERAGALAARAMMEWVSRQDLPLKQRAQAYRLLPDVREAVASLQGECATIVQKAFDRAIAGRSYLLSERGQLEPEGGCLLVPPELLNVWSPADVSRLFDDASRPILAPQISGGSARKLLRRGAVTEVTKDDVLEAAEDCRLPKPATWERLLHLWDYLAPDITSYRLWGRRRALAIVPVQGEDALYATQDVVRVGDTRQLGSDDDWAFLAAYVRVLDHDWQRYLAEQRQRVPQDSADRFATQVHSAYGVLNALELERASDINHVVELAAAEFFSQVSPGITESVRLAQIAAKLGVITRESFRFVTRDGVLRSVSEGLAFDFDGFLETVLPPAMAAECLLHEEYSTFRSCSLRDWRKWLAGGRSGVGTFPPPRAAEMQIRDRREVERILRQRGSAEEPTYTYRSSYFTLQDWDFDEVLWDTWHGLSDQNPHLWVELVERILQQSGQVWAEARHARMWHLGYKRRAAVVDEPLRSNWILRLSELPCLLDTDGNAVKPSYLMRRTEATNALFGVEPFVHARFDTDAARPLLDLLGVRSAPAGPDRVLEYLRALATAPTPPIGEVEMWYRRLDQLADHASTDDMDAIRRALREERLILSEGGTWHNASAIFLSAAEEDVPGAPLVRTSVRSLALWRRAGVADRPTVELAVEWLRELPSGEPLCEADARRVRAMLARHPARIWSECGHWLNLAGEWVSTEHLGYGVSTRSSARWNDLDIVLRKQTADFRMVNATTDFLPASQTPSLESCLEYRILEASLAGKAEPKPWLAQLGAELTRVRLPDRSETERVRALAADLAQTEWRTTSLLEVLPYLNGIPAGSPSPADALWAERILYVRPLPMARVAHAVAQESGAGLDVRT